MILPHWHENAMSLLYPKRCPVCDEVLYTPDTPTRPMVCPTCFQKLECIHTPYCMRCGKQLEEDEREYCADCLKFHPKNDMTGTPHPTSYFDRGLAAFSYTEAIKHSMYAFKNGRREYAAFYASQIDALYHDAILSWKAEVLVPVPLHPSKLRTRGYNQAEDLAKALGRLLQIPVDTRLLTRARKTADQKTLNDKERKNNAKNAFQLGRSILEYRKIILVDDIYTTGMTINECARPLREAGADRIYFLTACVGRGF